MANGVMERGLKQAEAERAEDAAGWAAPAAATATVPDAITPDTVSEWTPAPPRAGVETMTMRGVASATGVLLVLLIAAGAVGWNLVDTEATGQIRFPGWLLFPLFAAVGVAFLTMFKPELARFTGPIYALLEGLVLGAISRASTRKHGTASSCRPSPSRSSSSVRWRSSTRRGSSRSPSGSAAS